MVHPPSYLAMEGYSNSQLKLLEDSPFTFHKYMIGELPWPDKKSEAMLIGDLTELLFTEPGKLTTFYHVMNDADVPDGRVREIIDEVYLMCKNHNNLESVTLEDDEIVKYISLLLDEKPINSGWKYETQLKKVQDAFPYFLQLRTIGTKIPITNAQLAKAGQLVSKMKACTAFAELFTNDPDVEIRFSFEANAKDDVSGYKLKGLLDMLMINHRLKFIQSYDLKTADSFEQFITNYFMSRYYRQGAIYTFLTTRLPEAVVDGYEVRPFKFAVVSKQPHETCRMYTMTAQETLAATVGGVSTRGTRIKGWHELMVELKWHQENDIWEHPMEYYRNGDTMLLNYINPYQL